LCSLKLKGNDVLLIGVLYRSPGSLVSENYMFIEQFSTVLKENHSHMLIMGDFKYPEIDWKLQISHAAANHPSQDFITCYKDWFLYQHVTPPTHYRAQQNANILDMIITNSTTPQLFYGPFSGTTRVSQCQKRLWCRGKLTEADTPTIRLGATLSGLTSAHLHHPPFFYRPDALPAAQPTVSKH